MAADFLRFGLFTGATALVLSNDVPTVVKFVARIAKRFLGPRIQICDGVEDDIEAQAAHDALPVAGGREVFTAGDFNFGPTTGTLAMNRTYVTVQGQGSSTRFVVVETTPTANNTIDVTADYCTLLDLCIIGGGAFGTTSGNNGVRFSGCDYCLAERVNTENVKLQGLTGMDCKYLTFRTCNALIPGGTTGSGCGFYFGDLCEDCLCTGCVSDGAKEWNFRTFDNGAGPPARCSFVDCTSLRSVGTGFNFGDCIGPRATNCKSVGDLAHGFANQNCTDSVYETCLASGAGTGGFRLLTRADMTDCHALGCGTYGYHVRGTNSTLTACHAWNNGQALGADPYGFQLRSGDDIVLTACVASDDQGIKTQTFGLDLAFAPNRVQMFGGSLEGNLTGPVQGHLADGRYVGVRGFVTENSGTGSIGAAAVAVNITHNLDVTPQDGDIMVTPTNDMGNATKMWVSAYAADTFTVTIDAVPGGVDTADFAWKAMVLPH